jgi:tetratricopeptide (TPR) repeat protein
VQVYGYQAWAIYCYHIGRIHEAAATFQASVPAMRQLLEDPQAAIDMPMLVPALTIGMGFAAGITELNGDRHRATSYFADARRLTARFGPLAEVTIAMFASVTGSYAGDATLVLELTTRAIELDPDADLAFMTAFIRLMNAWALCLTGDLPTGLQRFDDALAGFLASQARTGHGMWEAFHAEALVCAGDLDAAAGALERAFAAVERTGERQALPLCIFVRAALGAARHDPQEQVVADLADAERIAREQGAIVLAERARRTATALGVSATAG